MTELLYFAVIPIAVMAVPMIFGMLGKKKAGVALAAQIQKFGTQQKSIKAFVRECVNAWKTARCRLKSSSVLLGSPIESVIRHGRQGRLRPNHTGRKSTD